MRDARGEFDPQPYGIQGEQEIAEVVEFALLRRLCGLCTATIQNLFSQRKF